jgi:capsid protein
MNGIRKFGRDLARAVGEGVGRVSAGTRFGYDAVNDRGKRKALFPLTRSEDRELWPVQRRRLIAGTRDLPRNFTIAAWMVRKHLDYVSTFKFRARTGVPDLDDEIEALMRWWSRPANCDVAARHSLPRLVRMLEACRTIDGDVLLNLLSDGRLQAIEGDRVRTPIGGVPAELKLDLTKMTHGVLTDDYGKAIAYAVCERPRLNNMGDMQSDNLVFKKLLSATYTRQLGYFSRIDQVRGVSPLAPAINSLRDIYESIGYAVAKAKVSQLFAVAMTRDNSDPMGEVSQVTTTGGGDDEDEETPAPRYMVDFNGGPVMFDLDPGDKAEIIESKNPSTEFQSFMGELIPMAIKALDIPACFYDEGRANFSSGRQGWLLYDQSAASKRDDLRELLDYVTAWRLKLFVKSGDLLLPKGMMLRDLKTEWIHAGIPWIDPLKEATANTMEINNGTNSRQRICKAGGIDFFDVVDELAEEAEYAKKKGVAFKETPIAVTVTSGDGGSQGQQQD